MQRNKLFGNTEKLFAPLLIIMDATGLAIALLTTKIMNNVNGKSSREKIY